MVRGNPGMHRHLYYHLYHQKTRAALVSEQMLMNRRATDED